MENINLKISKRANGKLLTKEQVNKKYKGKYVKVIKKYDYTNQRPLYEVIEVYSSIHEDTTLGEDIGTIYEYGR